MSKAETTIITVSKTTHKIGRTTYVVSSTYAEGSQHKYVSAIARLIRNNADLSVGNTAKSA